MTRSPGATAVIMFPVLIRILLTASTLFTLLGPTFADAVGREEVPAPPQAEPSVPDDDDRPRPSRRQRRHTGHLDGNGAAAGASDGNARGAADAEALDSPTPDTRPAAETVIGALDDDAPLDLALLPSDVRRTVGFDLAARNPGQASGSGANHGPSDLKGAPGCTLQCITSGVAYARGINAELVVTTDTPATVSLYVYGAPSSQHTSGPNVTNFAVLLDDLQPGSEYYVIATATDSQGKTSYAHGTFRTMRRVAEVTFHLNWAVTQTPYDVRFHYHYRVADAWRDNLSAGYWPFPQPPANLPQPVTVQDAPRHLDLAAQVVVEAKTHNGFGQGGCPTEAGAPAPFGPFEPSGGVWSGTGEATTGDGCHPIAWATAARCLSGFDLDARPPGTTSWTQHQLAVSVSTNNGCSNQPLTFTVPATIDVSYVP